MSDRTPEEVTMIAMVERIAALEADLAACREMVQQGADAMSSIWNLTEKKLPPEGAVVDTLSSNGTQQQLKRQGRLWFVPDGTMYVYYTPKFWCEIDSGKEAMP